MAGSKIPGIQYLALDSAGTLFDYQGGWADIGHRLPMTVETTMMAYSMSKTITAAAVLQLVGAGVVGLDVPVQHYIATPYGPGISVRQLLSHTSGIPNPIPLRWVHLADDHATFDETAALGAVLAAHPALSFAPGARYLYSNIGYWLLGHIVERVSGRSFTAYVTERVLAPLGMPRGELGYAIPDSTHHANGYLEKYSFLNLAKRLFIAPEFIGDYEGRWLRIKLHYLNGPAFGGLVGTARGFGRFLQDQLRHESALFDATTRDLFYAQQRTAAGAPVPMTLGWHIGDLGGVPFCYKEGGGGGFHSLMRLYPAERIGTVVMANATGVDVKSLLNVVDPLARRHVRSHPAARDQV